MGSDAVQIAPVPGVHFVAVRAAFPHAWDVVVVGVAVGKPIGHDEVHRGPLFPTVVTVGFAARFGHKARGAPPTLLRLHLNFDVVFVCDSADVEGHPNMPRQRRRTPRFELGRSVLKLHVLHRPEHLSGD